MNAAEDGRGDVALGMGAALWRFWQRRAHLAEGRTVLEGLLDMPVAAPRTAARAKALAALGGVRYWQGDLAAAGQAYAEALAIERELDDPAGLAEALYDAGFVAAITGDHATARKPTTRRASRSTAGSGMTPARRGCARPSSSSCSTTPSSTMHGRSRKKTSGAFTGGA